MKKIYLLFLFLLLKTVVAISQTTVTLTLNAGDEDAEINDYNPAGNYPNEIEYYDGAWTISGTQTIWRNLFKFDLTCIPTNATIQSAQLSLYYADSNTYAIYAGGFDTSLTNSNESVLQRVTSAWTENTVTWNNQPSTTNVDEVILPPSISPTQDYTNIDVTSMLQQMVSSPAANNGFLLKLTNEVYYAQLIFASGDNPVISKHPSLQITYTVPIQICQTFRLSPADEDATVDNYSLVNNYPDEIEYYDGVWTISSTETIWRNLFKFNLSCIPINATVQSAYLTLNYADSNNYGIYAGGFDTSLTSSNESVIQRVTSSWTENTVTWNNQPSSTTTDQLILPASTSPTQDYPNLDVSAMVQPMVSNPSANYGFLLKLLNEVHYAQLIFASSDYPNPEKRPVLEVCYVLGTGVDEMASDFNVSVVPNPSSGLLQVKLSEKFKGDLKIQIYNSIGKIVLEKYRFMGSSSTIVTIDVSDFSAGVYCLQLESDNRMASKKFIKQ